MWIVQVWTDLGEVTVFGPYSDKETAEQEVTNIEDTFPELLQYRDGTYNPVGEYDIKVEPMLSGDSVTQWFLNMKTYREEQEAAQS